MDPITIVIATRNQGKTAEIRALLQDYPVDIKDVTDFGPIPEPVEDGTTFDENAYKKAHFTARVLGLPALADDSGLEVEALGGAPGVHSARYAGPDADDRKNYEKLLREMEGKENRRARFVCVLSLAVPTGPALTYEGYCEGEITTKPRGNQGFGYDPVFYYPPLGKTFAEMSLEEKSSVSHRGRALREFRDEFDKVLVWLRKRLAEEKRLLVGDICQHDHS